jgi:hypothetical protein
MSRLRYGVYVKEPLIAISFDLRLMYKEDFPDAIGH